MNGLLRLEGKVALVTGADLPLGSATALRFAREGAMVVLNDVGAGHLDRVAAEITDVESGRALIALGDVTRPAHVERILRETLETFGALDIVVTIAGADPDAATRGAAVCAETILPHMRERGAGRVIIVSSPGGLGPGGHASADASLLALTRKLALESAPHGVTVNCVVPGAITAPGLAAPDSAEDAMTAVIPMSRLGTAREVAAAVTFLASDDASYITGQVLQVDGGLSLGS